MGKNAMKTSESARFIRLVNFVEHIRRRPLEADIPSVIRHLSERAEGGWELVSVCDDELGSPQFVYKRMSEHHTPPIYTMEMIPTDNMHEQISTVVDFFNEKLKADWVPVCVVENALRRPIAIMKKAEHSCTNMRVTSVPLRLKAFGKQPKYVCDQLFDQQTREYMTLACTMYGGLHPVMIMISNDAGQPFDYMVDTAFGGFYRNQTTTLADLIQTRSEEGWHVSGIFKDALNWPCVIFKRETKTRPEVPLESA